MNSPLLCARSESEKRRSSGIGTVTVSVGILSVFMMPYTSLGFRIDQLLIPISVVFFLFFYGIPMKLFRLLTLNFLVLLFVPLLLALIRINLSGYSFNIDFMIRELQNILKMPIYLIFGYFIMIFLSEKAFLLTIKLLIAFAFAFTLLTVVQNNFGIPGYKELSFYYNIHPFASSMGRFPGIFTQPATAGMFFAVMSYVVIIFKNEIPPRYLVPVFLVGIFATSKVFVFSIPFVLLALLLKEKFKHNNTAKLTQKSTFSASTIVMAALTLLFIIIMLSMFREVILNSFNYLLGVISYDPLAGRGKNITMESISIILNRFPLFGIGLISADQFSNTALIGLWDSLLYYDLYHYGLIGMLIKNLFITAIFLQCGRNKTEIGIFSIMLVNLFAIGIGIPVFGQERISDFMWIFIGYLWTRKNI